MNVPVSLELMSAAVAAHRAVDSYMESVAAQRGVIDGWTDGLAYDEVEERFHFVLCVQQGTDEDYKDVFIYITYKDGEGVIERSDEPQLDNMDDLTDVLPEIVEAL